MDYMVVISAIVLGLSVLAALAKLLDWFVHSDPKTMLRTARWMLLLLLIVGVGILIYAVATEQWSLALLDGSALLIAATIWRWRVIAMPLRMAYLMYRRRRAPADMEVRDFDPADPETVRRAAAILEAYVARSSPVALNDKLALTDGRRGEAMSSGEALEVLGLEPDADDQAIRAARKRLLGLVHPDRGGSAWLAGKVQQASDTLLGPARQWPPAAADDRAPPRNRATKRS
jgi:Zn-dependent protease with chaperone function